MKSFRASFPQWLLHLLSSSRAMSCLFLAMVVLHTLRSILLFSSPSALVDHNPILNDDYSYHFYYSLLGSSFLNQHYTSWGYDPYFMAGYPKTIMADPSNNMPEVLVVLLPFIAPAVIFKLTVVLAIALVPILVYYACKNIGLTRSQCILGSFLGIADWWLGRAYLLTLCGLFAFIFASYICLLISTAFYRFFQTSELKMGLLVTILVPLTFLIHPTTPVILIVPVLVLSLWSWKKLSKTTQWTLCLIFILTLGINSFWLIPFATFHHYKTTSAQFMQSSGLAGFVRDYVTVNRGIELPLLVFGLLGLYLWTVRKEHLKYLFLGSGLIFLLLVSYYGSAFPFIADLQPQRFFIPFNIFLVVPATFAISWLINTVRDNPSKKKWLMVILIFSAVLAPLVAGKRFILAFDVYSFRPFITSLHPGNQALIQWITETTTNEGRILIEDSCFLDTHGKDVSPWGHQFYLTHLPGLLPYYTGREFIGGPHPFSIIQHHFAEFHDGILFKKAIDTFTLPDVQSYFDLYNIKWIICWSDNAQTFFNQYPDYLLQGKKVDKFYTYTVNRMPSYFFKGKGRISAGYNKLQLTEIEPNGEIIIKYHWLPQFKTDPPRTIEKAMIMDDPIGFIKILNPPSSIMVYNGY